VLLIEADATDPARPVPAWRRPRTLADRVFDRDLTGPLARSRPAGPVDVSVHAHYNPENITQYNVVPGLMGVVLTMTMVIITALAITRERERGTMENLLSTPVRPFEVMLGKILPYIAVGYIQVTLILVAARFIFHVPLLGSLAAAVRRIASSSSRPTSPSASRSRPSRKTSSRPCRWRFSSSCRRFCSRVSCFRSAACRSGRSGSAAVLPNTHFLRIVRGILLKGNGPPRSPRRSGRCCSSSSWPWPSA
jgi:ABC-2 type transport system permease protein